MKQIKTNLLFLFILIAFLGYSQKVKKDSIVYKDIYGIRIGIDIANPIRTFFDNNRKSLELVADYRVTKKIYAAELLQPYRNNADNWELITNNDSLLQFSSGETQTIGGSFPGIGKSNQLTGTLLAMDEGEISGVIETFNAALVLQMTSRDTFDDSLYQEEYSSIRNQLLNSVKARGFTSWLTDAKKSIKQEDYRSEVY